MYDNDPQTIQAEVGKVLRDPGFLARQGEQEVSWLLRGVGLGGWLEFGPKSVWPASIGRLVCSSTCIYLPWQALKADLVRLVPGLTADNFKW